MNSLPQRGEISARGPPKKPDSIIASEEAGAKRLWEVGGYQLAGKYERTGHKGVGVQISPAPGGISLWPLNTKAVLAISCKGVRTIDDSENKDEYQ